MEENLELKNTTKAAAKPELNGFLVFVLVMGIIGSVISNISECLKYSLLNDFVAVFCVIDFILVAIHIVGIVIILSKKSIYGYYIIVGNFILSILLCPTINSICDYVVFDIQNITIQGIMKIIIISLLLLLRKNGISAYKTLTTKKSEEKKTKKILVIFSAFISLFVIICLIVGVIVKSDKNNFANKTANVLNTYSAEHLFNETSNSEKNIHLNTLEFNGLSFSYPDNWKIETEILQENLGFQVSCEKKGLSSEIISVVWLRGTNFGTTTEMVENSIDGISEEMAAYNAKINSGEIYKSIFKGCSTVCLDYNFTLFDEAVYGKLFSFAMNNNTVIITKQSDTKDKLYTDFQLIEESFNLK